MNFDLLTPEKVSKLMETRKDLIAFVQSAVPDQPKEMVRELFTKSFEALDEMYEEVQIDPSSIPKYGWQLKVCLAYIIQFAYFLFFLHKKIGLLYIYYALSFSFSKYFSFMRVTVYKGVSVKEALAQKNPEVIQLFPDTTNYTFEIFGTNRLKAESLPCVILINGRDIDINAANFLNYSFRFEFVRS